MRPTLPRTTCLGLLVLTFSACQRQSYSFKSPAAPSTPAGTHPVAARADSVRPVYRAAPAGGGASSQPAARPQPSASLRHVPAGRSSQRRLHPVKPVIMARNTQARSAAEEVKTPAKRRPRITENQLVALVLLGGGSLLTAAGLLLIFVVGGVGVIIVGTLLGLVGLGLIWGWLYLRGLGKAYQH